MAASVIIYLGFASQSKSSPREPLVTVTVLYSNTIQQPNLSLCFVANSLNNVANTTVDT